MLPLDIISKAEKFLRINVILLVIVQLLTLNNFLLIFVNIYSEVA